MLTHWTCSNISYQTTDDPDSEEHEVRGSLGELNIILFKPAKMMHGYPFITIAWRAERILPGVLRIHKIVLDLSTVRTIHFHHTRNTSVEVVHVQAPKNKFIHLGLPEINYALHSEMYPFRSALCRDGFEITDPMMIHIWGRICSNSTAQNLFNHYRMDGFTVGQEIILIRKQYAWLATISAVFTATLHSCAGYINPLPRARNMFSRDEAPWAIVRYGAITKTFEDGSHARYSEFIVTFERSPKACCKIQIVPFHELVLYEMELDKYNIMYTYLTYTIISKNITSPARFIMDFSAFGDSLRFTNTSSVHAIRMASLNSRYVNHSLPYTGLWDTEAYSANIRLHSSSLTHAAGFTVQVEDGRSPPACTFEHITNVTTLLHDLHLPAPSANVELIAHLVRFVLIHKSNEKKTCCQFVGYITTDHSINAKVELKLIHAYKYKLWFLNRWDLSGNNTIIKFHVICIHSCSAIEISFKLDGIALHTVRVAYHASFIGDMYPTGLTFRLTYSPQPRLVPWNQACHNHHCYITPRRHTFATWDEARKACEKQQATLVSINSYPEWALITRIPQENEEFIEFYDIHQFVIFYIGLFTDVSTEYERL